MFNFNKNKKDKEERYNRYKFEYLENSQAIKSLGLSERKRASLARPASEAQFNDALKIDVACEIHNFSSNNNMNAKMDLAYGADLGFAFIGVEPFDMSKTPYTIEQYLYGAKHEKDVIKNPLCPENKVLFFDAFLLGYWGSTFGGTISHDSVKTPSKEDVIKSAYNYLIMNEHGNVEKRKAFRKDLDEYHDIITKRIVDIVENMTAEDMIKENDNVKKSALAKKEAAEKKLPTEEIYKIWDEFRLKSYKPYYLLTTDENDELLNLINKYVDVSKLSDENGNLIQYTADDFDVTKWDNK